MIADRPLPLPAQQTRMPHGSLHPRARYPGSFQYPWRGCYSLPPPVSTTKSSFPKGQDRKSTRLNSSHANISYAVFCLKKKQNNDGVITEQLIRRHDFTYLVVTPIAALLLSASELESQQTTSASSEYQKS